ncbi:hypothetical protein F2Q69_00060570 [Brassica cretica]|uniref:DUF1985 domain-containing protein n=1 Tax=Brassica cretica TaxID=69181 RepID=A0A8S9RAB6_BRACR|nr:hypothetical protein F2Q69_00060570 [Brassica cretica]
MAPKKDKVPPPSSKTAKSGGGKQKKMGARNHPAESIKLPKLVDISGDASKVDLIALLQDKKIERTECEKLSLASLILVEGIILGRYTAKIIATSSLQEVLNFEDYIRKPWGKIGFEFLRTQIVKMSAES